MFGGGGPIGGGGPPGAAQPGLPFGGIPTNSKTGSTSCWPESRTTASPPLRSPNNPRRTRSGD